MSRLPDDAPSDDLESGAWRVDVGRWVEDWAAVQPDQLAWADETRRCSWREAAERVERLSSWLLDSGVEPGDRVAFWLGNRGAVLEIVFACARIGAIALPINARLTPHEVAFQLRDAAPRVLFVDRGHGAQADLAIAEAGGAEPVRLEVAGHPQDAYEEALRRSTRRSTASSNAGRRPAAKDDDPSEVVDPDRPMILMYTSGTTGAPKGALLPLRKTLANCENACTCFGTTRRDRVLIVAPLFHSLGLQILALPALYAGASLVIQDGFDADRVWETITTEAITYLGAVPTAHQRLLDALARRGASKPASLRFLFTAGAAAPTALIRAYHDRGLSLIQGYGQTETSLLTCLDADRALAKAGSVGRPLPLCEIRVIDPATADGAVDDWRDVAIGEVGEVVVHGRVTMLGYWRRPEATRETLRDGWIRTGDLATRDADFDLTLVGRAREMYISGGENVYPAEVEAVLESHPAIAEAAVVAEPDPTWGEVGCAHLVARAGAALDVEALPAWLAPRLARFKQPRRYVVEAALPRTASGKVQKHRLQATAEEPA